MHCIGATPFGHGDNCPEGIFPPHSCYAWFIIAGKVRSFDQGMLGLRLPFQEFLFVLLQNFRAVVI